ncbi:MAG: cytochrome c oxidase assembly protein [Candidatus Promineifilaceae bacterium]|nr:cytochrome c oxidase assembly protein [Candidatus Promineifilaceae bacterium]
MDPVTSALLRSWEWRAEVFIPLLLFGVVYTLGWRTLRAKGSRLANGWRLVSYWTGIAIIVLALLSPIETLSGQFFFMHMIQHLLLVMLAPPLLLLANPMPFLVWGLPPTLRRPVAGLLARLLRRNGPFRGYLRTATNPGIAWMLFVAFLIGWHDPGAYTATLRSELVHDLEHLSFFFTAMLYWWHAVGAAPLLHRPLSRPARIAYVIAVIPPNMFLGVVLAFAGQVIYTYYETVPRVWGIDPISDQTIGGIIMWVPGSMMYIIAVLILTARWLEGEESKPPLPFSKWATDERMIAPGLEK